MNFNYSYKAFLITTLLVGGLYLIMYFTFLPSAEAEINEEEYEIEFVKEEILEKDLASAASEKTKIETHRAFNEAEDFIEDLENDRQENPESLEEKLSEIDKAIQESEDNHEAYESSKKNISEKNKNSVISEKTLKSSITKNSTNSYRLINRKATYFPNPVYTCEGFGKVVLHIEVDASGKVVVASLNSNSSTTTNACLIESAINYAEKARFSPATKASQMGSITYIFPGQE